MAKKSDIVEVKSPLANLTHEQQSQVMEHKHDRTTPKRQWTDSISVLNLTALARLRAFEQYS
jgi:hypothetical protein